MRPANTEQAQKQIYHLLKRKLPRLKPSMQREHHKRAKEIINTLYKQYQIGPYQIQLRHLHWYLTTQINQFKPATQYRYWLTIERIIIALDRQHWQDPLQGPWVKPE